VDFVGGEPTIHDELQEAIGLARRIGFERIGLQTNGRRLAYRSYTELLVTAGLTHVDVSLHGPTAPVHEFHTTVEGSFQQTVAGGTESAGSGPRDGDHDRGHALERAPHVHARGRGHRAGRDAVARRDRATRWPGRRRCATDRAALDGRRAFSSRRRTGLHRRTPVACASAACRRASLRRCLAGWIRIFPFKLSMRCGGCALRETCPGVDPVTSRCTVDAELQPFSIATPARALDAASAESTSFVGRVGRPAVI
jgi:hypothetical protein